MKKRILCFLSILFLLLSSENIFAESARTLSITGAVKQPLTLTMEDIKACQSISVQLNEITKDNKYKGIFSYQGVPLKTLLQLSCIDKGKTDFSKHVDLAILIKTKKGQQTVLSWGEVFLKIQVKSLLHFQHRLLCPTKTVNPVTPRRFINHGSAGLSEISVFPNLLSLTMFIQTAQWKKLRKLKLWI